MQYFDTSALFPYYRPEAISTKVQKLLRAPKAVVAISPLVEVEFASVLARLVRMKELSDAHAATIHAAFEEDLGNGCFERIEIGSTVFRLAEEWLLSRKTPLRTLDALHLANAALAGAKLITGDEVLARAAKQFGVPVSLIAA